MSKRRRNDLFTSNVEVTDIRGEVIQRKTKRKPPRNFGGRRKPVGGIKKGRRKDK